MRFRHFLSICAVLSSCCPAWAAPVPVSSWDEIVANLADTSVSELVLAEDVNIGSSITLGLSRVLSVDGGGNFLNVVLPEGADKTYGLFSVKTGGSLTFSNFSVSGSVHGANFPSDSSVMIFALEGSSRKSGNLTLENANFSNIKLGNNSPGSLLYASSGNAFKMKNIVFSNNEMTIASIRGGFLNSYEIDGCTFATNGSLKVRKGGALVTSGSSSSVGIIRNSTFSGNHVEGSSVSEGIGGAIYGTHQLSIEDSEFSGNYTMAGENSSGGKGGAIFMEQADNSAGSISVSVNISSISKDTVFSGNRTGVTKVGADGMPQDGTANAVHINMSQYITSGSGLGFRVRAKKDTSVIFYDPIVIDKAYNKLQGGGAIYDSGTINFNAKSTESPELSQGKIIFSGEKYTEDADRMSRIKADVVMKQWDGEVIITKGASLGGNMTSTNIGEAKNGQIDNYGYHLYSGTLTMTEGGSLIAGGFMVGVNWNNSMTIGYGSCTLSVGSGASLTTGWVKMDQGVSFDLVNFFKTGDTGLSIDLTAPGNYYVVRSGEYENAFFVPDRNSRFVVGGKLGLADSLDMYKDIMWKDRQDFLLLNLGDSAADAYNGSSEFTEIVSNTTGSSKVEKAGVNSGEWSQEWRDTNADGKKDQLYAVWIPKSVSIPEPGSAALCLVGLMGLCVSRKRSR